MLNADDTSQTIALFEILPGDYIVSVLGRVKTAVAGVTLPEVRVGFDAGGGTVIKKQPVNKAGDLLSGGTASDRSFCQKIAGGGGSGSARTLYAYFTSTATNFSSLTAGEIEFVCVRATA
jgi:hypothetical protein